MAEGAKMHIDTGWKKEMDALYKRTLKDWKCTGNKKKAKGISGLIDLGNKVCK
jgi:hypothetical protein